MDAFDSDEFIIDMGGATFESTLPSDPVKEDEKELTTVNPEGKITNCLKKKSDQTTMQQTSMLRSVEIGELVSLFTGLWNESLQKAMWSQEEIEMREKSFHLSVFEIDPRTSSADNSKDSYPKAKPEWMVKMYKRSASDTSIDPKEVRSLEVLDHVVEYLINNVLDSDSQTPSKYVRQPSSSEIFSFISDRFRAVRQDLAYLNTPNLLYISILERIARFHILSLKEFSLWDSFIFKINWEIIEGILVNLIEAYQQNYINEWSNVAEFYGYAIVLHLDDPIYITSLLYSWQIITSPWLKVPLDLLKAYTEKDFNSFLCILKNCNDFLLVCWWVNSISAAREQILSHMYISIKETLPSNPKKAVFRTTLPYLANLLHLDSVEQWASTLLSLGYNLETVDKGVIISRGGVKGQLEGLNHGILRERKGHRMSIVRHKSKTQ
jgi:hypothetical protein